MSRALILVAVAGCRLGFNEQMVVVEDALVDGAPDVAIDPDAMLVTRTFGERTGATKMGVTTDTTLTQLLPDQNLGLDEALNVDGMTSPERALLRFDLVSIAPGTQIISARIELEIVDFGDQIAGELALYPCTEAWNEATATWSSRDTNLGWTAAGGSPDATMTAVGSTSTSVISIAVPTATVQSWVDAPSGNHGFLVGPADPQTDTHYHFYSSESQMVTARPLLHVELAL